jgi:hypothetical protein
MQRPPGARQPPRPRPRPRRRRALRRRRACGSGSSRSRCRRARIRTTWRRPPTAGSGTRLRAPAGSGSLGTATRGSAPAHHRRQPHDELLDRRCKPRRARRMPEPEQIALDRIDARLQPIIAGRDAAAPAPRGRQQRTDDQAPGLGRQRLARRPVPATARNTAARRGGVLQRHRQRPSARAAYAGQRRRADARGAAGRTRHTPAEA